MWLLLVPVFLAIFSSSLTSASEPHYVITVPAHLDEGTETKACVTFLDLKGPTDIKIELKHEDQVHIVTEQKITTHDHSECYTFQVPQIKDGASDWILHVSAHGENINVDESKKVEIFENQRKDVCVIQTDKSTYKAGDIVKFHVISVNSDLRPINKQHHLVEIIDPHKNHIAQWLDVSTKQGFAAFSFHLANELTIGEYRINIHNGCDKYFKVDEYVSKRFESHINVPSDVIQTDKSFHLETCGRYTYGKPVEGVIDLLVCAKVCQDGSCKVHPYNEEETAKRNCLIIKGEKTDGKGCVSRDIQLGYFNMSTTEQYVIEIKSKVTEDGTGHTEEASADLDLYSVRKTLKFLECDKLYTKGFPYHGKVQFLDEKKKPIVNEALKLYIMNDEDFSSITHVNLVTDSHGIAHFTLKTSEWATFVMLKVQFLSGDHEDDDEESSIWDFGQRYIEDMFWLSRLYSKSESRLSIQKHPDEVPCNSDLSVTVEYDIQSNLESNADHLHFFYILLSKNGIFSYKEHKVDTKDQANSPRLQGSFPLNFHVEEDFFPRLALLVFSVLPNGETIARATDYNVSPCAKSKVKLSFSEEQVRPGGNVNLEVTAEAGSLCSVRSVDKGYLLKNPHYTDNFPQTDVIERLRESDEIFPIIHLLLGPDKDRCPENTSPRSEHMFDVYTLFQMYILHIFTNTEIREPVECVSDDIAMRSSIKKKKPEHKDTRKKIQKHFTRSYFPDSWLYELVPMGSDGHTVLNRTTPHTITKWVTDAFCLGSSGFASVKDVEFTTFQPYFIDLILPQSVVQGEKFTIQAMVFSYVKKCILIVVSLSDSEDLRTANEKEQARCVCEGHSHTFSWDVTALKPKTLKIHVDSGSIDVDGDCKQDVLSIGEDHRKDSVEKTIVVKPRGYEEEKTKTFLLLPSDNREAFTINIDAPERLVAGSERAHIIIQGDLMANFIANVDNILPFPGGCGEQNIAKFARYVYALQYLESIQELTPEQKAKTIESLVEGYQQQLTFRTENGSFTTFPGGSENVWLTAFTIKVLNSAQKFIYIDERHIQQAVNWLHSKQQPDGCFSEEEEYYNNEVEENNPVARTAYITIALLEHQVVYNGSIVENALSCLRKSVDNPLSVHTQALLAYAFTLSGDSELRDHILKKLDESAVRKGLKINYSKGDLETASYIILALLSEKMTTIKNLEDSADVVRWLVKHQNPMGGFHSSQDTTMALQALAKYARAITHKKGDSTVTIKSKSGFEKTFHVDKSNSLLVQTVDLPEIPGEYSVSATGNGFVYLQSHLHYNVLPEKPEKGYFSFNISTEPSTCNHASWKRFDVHIDVSYSGKRENTNMAMIIVETVSGYVPDKDSVKKLRKNSLVERTEMVAQKFSIYLTKLTHEPVSFVFSLEQEAPVQNLQPASAVVFDYYNPGEHTVVEYSAPCSEVVAHCAVSAEEREDCGFPNISRDQCHQKGCCYDHSIPGTKWCFFQDFKKTENH